MTTERDSRKLTLTLIAAAGVGVVLAGCGGSGGSSETSRAAAISLQQSMNSAARNIDEVRATHSSLDRLESVLGPSIAQTNDVVVTLTPKSGAGGVDSQLLEASRQQRSFLQFAANAAGARSVKAGRGDLARARAAGRKATDTYSEIVQADGDLAGVVPNATSFNLGRLTAALYSANRKRGATPKNTPAPGGGGGDSASTSCGGGISVNSATSCAFGINVAAEYQYGGGSGTVRAYSPVTKQTYTMTCTGQVPVVCTGGNNAVVTIR